MADQLSNTEYKRTHNLTVEEVKACPMLTHLTDEEAVQVIEALKTFAKIAYDYYEKSVKNADI